MTWLLRLSATGDRDVFLVRQRSREVASALGLDERGQVRLATALSEVCRHLLPAPQPVTVTFRVASAGIEVDLAATGPTPPELADGVAAAGRLMDRVLVTRTDVGFAVGLRRALPAHVAVPDAATVDRLRTQLAAAAPTSVLTELGVQSQQLITALEEAQAHRDELLRLNAELEETNRGVMALYGQLSGELEETNRGVVALYAELDERSAQLREASEAKSRFLRNVSHELRAPVTAIIGMIRLLLDPHSDPVTAEQAHQLGLAANSADDLLNLVNDLLDLAKAESNRLEPQWGSVGLGDLFGQLSGTLRHLAPAGVDLVVEPVADLPQLVTDQTLLAQVLRNLLSNALKFTEHGKVRLSAGHDPGTDRVRLVVADTGIGIAPDHQERIFEEFYQVPRAQRGAVPGTGLGLPYVVRLCALLGAELRLHSQEGVGSTFTVELPRVPEGTVGHA